MSETDISAKGILIKYKDGKVYHYMHKGPKGDIIALPTKKGALLYTPIQAKKFLNILIKQRFPFKCGPETVK